MIPALVNIKRRSYKDEHTKILLLDAKPQEKAPTKTALTKGETQLMQKDHRGRACKPRAERLGAPQPASGRRFLAVGYDTVAAAVSTTTSGAVAQVNKELPRYVFWVVVALLAAVFAMNPRRPGSLRPGCWPGHRRRHRPDAGKRPELPRRPGVRCRGDRLRRLAASQGLREHKRKRPRLRGDGHERLALVHRSRSDRNPDPLHCGRSRRWWRWRRRLKRPANRSWERRGELGRLPAGLAQE